MIKHIVIFTWKDTVTPDDAGAMVDELRGLPGEITALADYAVGQDLGLTQGTGDLGIVATVADRDGLRAYLDHPRHVDVAGRLRAMASSRVAVQIEPAA